MDTLKVENIKIEEIKVKHTPELDELVKLMDKHGYPNGYEMLPTSVKHRVSFELSGTYSAFANGIRRALVEEIETKSLLIDEKDILTDDEFISGMNDVLIKNLSLIPIMQDGNFDEFDIYLYAYNNTNDIIDVKAKDLSIVKKLKKKGRGIKLKDTVKGSAEDSKEDSKEDTTPAEIDDEIESATPAEIDDEILDEPESKKSNVKPTGDISSLVPDTNIVIMRLRPGKYLKLRNIKFQHGVSLDHAGKFSLLNNVSYRPVDIDPYDQFTNTGTRTIEHDCKKFMISFETCGNITPASVIEKVINRITSDLNDIKNKITIYSKTPFSAYYSGQDCEVEFKNNVYNYKFPGHYVTPIYMIAMACYKLDENIPFCSATVERFDSRVGLIKIKHADPNKILIAAVDSCIADLKKLKSIG